IAQSHYCAAIVKKMECLKIILFLGLAATASAAVCTNTIGVDGGRGQSWACLEIGSGCITSYVRYPGIATNPTITFCEGHNSDGSQCHTATSSNICSDIPLLTIIKIPTPDLRGTLEFRVGFRSSPPKVCFSGPKDECGSSFQPTSTPEECSIYTDCKLTTSQFTRAEEGSTAFLCFPPKKYDLTLERFAQNYLDSLSTCLPQHNPNNSNYGENVYRQTTSKNFASDVNFEHMVQLWYDEVSYYNYWFNSCRLPEGLSCGHFTQVVWANTERVGCGVKICEDRNVTRTLVVCNYDPAGNIKPDRNSPTYRPYTSGLPCTRCPSTHPSCQNNFCVQSSGAQEVKQQLAEDVLKILLGLHGDKPQAGVEEWEMGSNGS
ncbi:Peptidase inhibitor 16, partial [Geodia barretti]